MPPTPASPSRAPSNPASRGSASSSRSRLRTALVGSAAALAAVLAVGLVAPAHSATTYRVQAGDTLAAISSRHGTTTTALAAANGITRVSLLQVGRLLVIPAVRAASGRVDAPGTNIPHTTSRQVVVADHTGGLRGTLARWEWGGDGTGWVKVGGGVRTTFGYGGLKPAWLRVQGDGSTPTGTYPLLYGFGRRDPGTALPYKTITKCSWWVGSKEPDYNRWRESCADPPRSGEHMASYMSRGLYEQGVVIGYNYARPILSGRGSGTGIFLHYSRGNTAGCVGLTDLAELTATLRWLDPAANPQIVIKA